MFDTLLKIDSKGKVREWDVFVKDYNDYAEIHVIHGEQGGKKQTKITTISNGKNIGRANETTYLEQAYAEAQSKWNKQHDKGYSVDGEKVFRPMLAHNFKDHTKKIKYPCYVQPKLDGLRCFIQWSTPHNKPVAYSRKGKEWNCVDHILEKVTPLLQNNPERVLDGELYTDKISFQKICSAIKRDEPNEYSKLVDFHCYDIFVKDKQKLSFEDRFKLIPNRFGDPFRKVNTFFVQNKAEIDIFHKTFIDNGYEGTIIRNSSGIYKVDGRSHDLLKYKDFKDAEYKIIGKTRDKNGECVFTCLDEQLDKTFDCKPRGTHEERVSYLTETNIGCYLTVRYFELTEDGLPRFPVGIAVRIDL